MFAAAAAFLTVSLFPACSTQDAFAESRRAMVREQLEARDIVDISVLRAMERVPRHEFVSALARPFAYSDRPLPIGQGQTISQPYIVALMTQLAELEPDDTVLEIGTGSGYQAAVLAEIVEQVFTVELLEDLAARARERLSRLGYDNVSTRTGDGYAGWEEHAPFDAILVTAAPERVPEALVEQLAPGGTLIAPVGPRKRLQSLRRIRKTLDGVVTSEDLFAVRFVPLVRERP